MHTFSSALTVRMFVSFFSRTGFTSKSFSRAHSPTTCSRVMHSAPMWQKGDTKVFSNLHSKRGSTQGLSCRKAPEAAMTTHP